MGLADYIELRRLTKETGGYLYKLALDSYNDIYNNIMSKGKIKLKPSFLGGNPVTLEQKDFTTLISNEYVVSTKADGSRFLLMIGNKSEFEQRHIFFIDRNNDFWILINNEDQLPQIPNIPNCLIDGELLTWGNKEQTEDYILVTPNKRLKTKPMVVFSCFDILYGPTNPTFEGENAQMQLVLGSSGAFMGPKGGYRWPWKKRYSVLKTMVLNNSSSFYQYNQLESLFRFKVVVSPFVNLNEVLKAPNPYSFMKNVFARELKNQFPNIPKQMVDKTDGLILTPSNTEYLKDSWAFCGNDQFKWKPSNELTVDLLIGRETEIDNRTVNKAYARQGKKKLMLVGYIPSRKQLNIGDIGECLWLEENYFDFKQYRPDKLKPNAYLTVLSVVSAIKEPFSMEALKIVYKYGIKKLIKESKKKQLPSYLKTVLRQFNNSYKAKCFLKHRPTGILRREDLDNLVNLINDAQINDNMELESRIKFKNYAKRLPYYNCIVSKVKIDQDDTPNPSIKKYGPNGVRRSDAVLGDHTILEEQIIKTPISKFKFEQSDAMKMAGYDISHIDFALSEELNDSSNFKPTMYRYQVRYEIDSQPLYARIPSVLWRVDITEFGDSKKNWDEAKRFYQTNPQTSIEIEYAPGDQENSVWRFYEDNPTPQNLLNIIDIFDLDISSPNPHKIKEALDIRVERYNHVSPEFIAKDYCRLLNWLFKMIY